MPEKRNTNISNQRWWFKEIHLTPALQACSFHDFIPLIPSACFKLRPIKSVLMCWRNIPALQQLRRPSARNRSNVWETERVYGAQVFALSLLFRWPTADGFAKLSRYCWGGQSPAASFLSDGPGPRTPRADGRSVAHCQQLPWQGPCLCVPCLPWREGLQLRSGREIRLHSAGVYVCVCTHTHTHIDVHLMYVNICKIFSACVHLKEVAKRMTFCYWKRIFKWISLYKWRHYVNWQQSNSLVGLVIEMYNILFRLSSQRRKLLF